MKWCVGSMLKIVQFYKDYFSDIEINVLIYPFSISMGVQGHRKSMHLSGSITHDCHYFSSMSTAIRLSERDNNPHPGMLVDYGL